MVSIGRLFALHGTIPVDKYTTLDVYIFKYMPESLMGPIAGRGELDDGMRYVLVPRDPGEVSSTVRFRKEISPATLEQIKAKLQKKCDMCKEPAPYEINFTTISTEDFSMGHTKRSCAPHVGQIIKDEKRANWEICRLNAPMAFSSSHIVALEQVIAECV